MRNECYSNRVIVSNDITVIPTEAVDKVAANGEVLRKMLISLVSLITALVIVQPLVSTMANGTKNSVLRRFDCDQCPCIAEIYLYYLYILYYRSLKSLLFSNPYYL